MRRLWIAAAAVWLPTGVTAGSWVLWSDRLPSRIATHWSGSGPADGFSPATGFWLGALIAGLVAGIAAVVAAAIDDRRIEDPAARVRRTATTRATLILGGSVAGAAAGMWVATAHATLTDPADPRLGWRFGLFLLGLAWGGVIRLIAGPPPRIDVPAAPPVDALDLGPTERAAFSTTLRSPLLLGVLLAATAVMLALAATVQPVLWLACPVPLIAALVSGQVRVTADRRGLRLVAGFAGITVKHIPLERIVRAEAADINPAAWGGWGYRVTPGRSALVLRGGPGLVLDLRDGRRFAVTMPDPRTPAALLNGLRSHTG
ncbi:DUF1648 domain-containing protein [Actinoplanes sp. DH11]|uniref:DUF1648 domain-containing protein n=1 Tax=Actinoplanes sp. DH11 TaxID=2857011 RepID=UPI001E58682E|nr:DUF1648 domain-containing protein [Actinoplanes sp. DH11]